MAAYRARRSSRSSNKAPVQRRYHRKVFAGSVERGYRALLARRPAWIALALGGGLACLLTCALAGAWSAQGIEQASAQSAASVTREGTISSVDETDWHTLFALAGETYAVTLQRITLPAAELSIWRPAHGESPARMVARTVYDGLPLVWTAPESGAWRARVAGRDAAVGTYRLAIRLHSDEIGADLASARLTAFTEDGTLIERSNIDNGGDVDWFAIPMAAGNRYVVWSVTGSLDSVAAQVRESTDTGFRELGRIGNAFSDVVEVAEDGLTVIAVRGGRSWVTGSYAFGVTRRGSAAEPEVSLPVGLTPRLQIASIEASSEPGLASFHFSGAWGPIRTTSGLRVWIDTDPGVDDKDEWEYLLRSNDGRQASIWSFAERRWIDSVAVYGEGFDTLVMRWSGRTANQQIRWQASIKNSDERWTIARPRLLNLPDPAPRLPELWFSREKTGAEDPRWQRELEAAGVIADLEEDAIVVALDAGHGLDSGGWDNGVKESDSNLAFALRVEELLEAEGVVVVQTRRASGRPYLNLDNALWRPDYQARAELAHRAKADVFVSIHSNANYLYPFNGLEAWYLPRWNGDGANLRLSEAILAHVQQALADYGYPTSTLTYDTSCWELVNGVCDPIYVLAPFLLMDADAASRWNIEPSELGLSDDPWDAPSNAWIGQKYITVGEPPINLINPQTQSGPGKIVRGNLMPTTLLELLYVSHGGDARILRDPAARELIAQAIADGILDFLDVDQRSG